MALELRNSTGISRLSPFGETVELMVLEQRSMLLITIMGQPGLLPRDLVEYLEEFALQFALFEALESQGIQPQSSYSEFLRSADNKYCSHLVQFEWDVLTRLTRRVLYLSEKGVMGLAPIKALPGMRYGIYLVVTCF